MDGWRRVSRNEPCPACGKPDWCAYGPDGNLKCERTAETPPGWRRLSINGNGAVFAPDDGSLSPAPRPKAPLQAFPTLDAAITAYGFGPPDHRHEYTTADGVLVEWVLRWGSGHSKKIRPASLNGVGWIQRHAEARPLPLYRLPALREADIVIVVEGEKDADAVAACGLAVTTNVMGAGKAGQTDWTPLAGKQVAIWPDPDEPGRDHADDVGRLLVGLGCSVRMLSLEQGGFEFVRDRHGGDDAAAADEIRSLIAAAPVWEPEGVAPNEPVEILIGTDEHRVNDEVLEALRRDPELYQRAGDLVHVVTDAAKDDQIRRAEGAPRIVAAPSAFVRERITRLAAFKKMTSKGPRPAHPPPWSVQAVMARGVAAHPPAAQRHQRSGAAPRRLHLHGAGL